MVYIGAIVDKTDERVGAIVNHFLGLCAVATRHDGASLAVQAAGFMDISPTELFV